MVERKQISTSLQLAVMATWARLHHGHIWRLVLETKVLGGFRDLLFQGQHPGRPRPKKKEALLSMIAKTSSFSVIGSNLKFSSDPILEINPSGKSWGMN